MKDNEHVTTNKQIIVKYMSMAIKNHSIPETSLPNSDRFSLVSTLKVKQAIVQKTLTPIMPPT
ncbi:hypothetical protein Fmac_007899 [Flemingia macrophylla]|uniref:Uncharacterized protein n=1 Tax=Flemingia macrophylla TaxID=520843 RepID=A0ABD1MVY1_9FABA